MSANKSFAAKVAVTQAELHGAVAEHLLYSLLGQLKNRLILVSLLVFQFATVGLVFFVAGKIVALVFLVFLLAMMPFVLVFVRSYYLKHLEKMGWPGEGTYEFSPLIYRWHFGSSGDIAQWNRLSEVVFTRNFVWFMDGFSIALVIPLRCFGTDFPVGSLLEILRQAEIQVIGASKSS